MNSAVWGFVDVSRYLSRYYSTTCRNTVRADDLYDMCMDYLDVLRLECLAERYYLKIKGHFVDHKSINKEAISMVKEMIDRLGAHQPKVKSYKYHLCYFILHINYYELEGDYQSMGETAIQAVNFFEALSYDHVVAKKILLMLALSALTRQGLYKEAAFYAKGLLNKHKSGTTNWFSNSQTIFILYQHTGEYDKAFSILNKVVQNRQLKSESHTRQLQWKLFELYVFFLQKSKK